MKLHGEVKNEELENEEVESKNKLMNEDEELKTGVNMFWRNFVLRDSSKVDSRGCLTLARQGAPRVRPFVTHLFIAPKWEIFLKI